MEGLRILSISVVLGLGLTSCSSQIDSLRDLPPEVPSPPLDGNEIPEERENFSVFSWSAVPSVDPEIQEMLIIRYSQLFDRSIPNQPGANFDTLLRNLKTSLDLYPAGRRVVRLLFELNPIAGVKENSLHLHPQDRCRDPQTQLFVEHQCPYMDFGKASVATNTQMIFQRLSELGAKIDYVILANEIYLVNWTMSEARLTAIQNDPRFITQLYPHLNFGLTDLATQALTFQRPATNYLKWNKVMTQWMAQAQNFALYNPIKHFYPNVRASNYQFYNARARCGEIPCGVHDKNGHADYLYTIESGHIGTAQSHSFYGTLGLVSTINTPVEMRPFPATPFNALIYAINRFRMLSLSSAVPIHPWLAGKTYSESDVFLANSDYYDELLFHLSLGKPHLEAFLLWNFGSNPAEDLLHFRHLLNEINFISGFKNLRSLSQSLHDWHKPYLLSRAQIGTKIINRLSLLLETTEQIESFVSLDGSTLRVALPAGELVFENAQILRWPNSTSTRVGVWILQTDPTSLVREISSN